MNRVVINLETELNQQRKDLKKKYGLRFEALDKWIYQEGMKAVENDNLFKKMGEMFNPKNK